MIATEVMRRTAHLMAIGAIEAREVSKTEVIWADAIERMVAAAQREAFEFGRKAAA